MADKGDFFDHFNEGRAEQEKLENVSSSIGKLLTGLAENVKANQATMDEVFSQYQEGFNKCLAEEGVEMRDIFTLPMDHPLQGYLNSLDRATFEKTFESFLAQAGQEIEEGQQWEAEAAVGETDETFVGE